MSARGGIWISDQLNHTGHTFQSWVTKTVLKTCSLVGNTRSLSFLWHCWVAVSCAQSLTQHRHVRPTWGCALLLQGRDCLLPETSDCPLLISHVADEHGELQSTVAICWGSWMLTEMGASLRKPTEFLYPDGLVPTGFAWQAVITEVITGYQVLL